MSRSVISTLALATLLLSTSLTACARPAARCPTSSVAATPAPNADPTAVSAATTRAAELFAAGDTAGGVAEGRRALLLAEAELDAHDRLRLQAQLELASMLLQTGAVDEAAALATAANTAVETELAELEGRAATTLKFLGTIALLKRDFVVARAHYQRAVELSERAAGPDDPETAKHLGNLATVLAAQGDTAAAETLLVRAVAIWDAAPAPHPVYTVQSLSMLAGLRLARHATDEALELYARGLAIQEQAWGRDSPRLGPILRDYAQALRSAGRTAEADALDQRRASF